MYQEHGEPVCRIVPINLTKADPDADLPKPSPSCVRSYPSNGGGRSKQNVTEVRFICLHCFSLNGRINSCTFSHSG